MRLGTSVRSEACGGLRSLLAMITLGYCVAFLFGGRSTTRRVLLMLITVPVAVGANVLRISGHIVGLVITTPPEKHQLVDETVYTRSAGAMTLLLDAKDSLTGEPLVRVGERQDITQADGIGQFYWSNPVSNAGAVRQLFDNWASRLRRELDQFKSLPEIPEA